MSSKVIVFRFDEPREICATFWTLIKYNNTNVLCLNNIKVNPELEPLHVILLKPLLDQATINHVYFLIQHCINSIHICNLYYKGYVGGQAGEVSQPVASQLTILKFVQISHSTTNAGLSNKQMYPYFMRIITADSVQARAIIAIVKGRFTQ